MPTSLPELRTSRQLVETARSNAAAILPTETHQSYPIPLDPAGRAKPVTFLYCTSRLEFGSGLFLLAPGRRVELDAATGEVLASAAVSPADLGVGDEPGKTLGRFGLPKDVSPEEYLKAKEALLDAYDRLLGPWYSGEAPRDAGRPTRAAAAEFRRAFAVVGEPPLAPYYRAVGKRFFAWLDDLAASG